MEFIVDSNKINNIKNVFPLLKKNPVVKIEKTGVNFFNKINEYLTTGHI